MRIIPTSGPVIELGTAEINPTVGMIDYSRRVTDDFGVTTVVKRGFARKISARVIMPFDQVSAAQVSLAKLRAQSARWEFDPDYDWLDFDGFYREFDLDLAVPPNSFCTLSVEGLAETEAGADDGSDPSPQDASTLIVVDPVQMTDAALVSTNVPENDYPAWAAGTTYALGARVIKVATHRIYESAGAGNIGNDPASLSGHWFDIGPTNRWAMFDQALGTATTRSGGMALQIGPGSVRAIALLDVVATSVRVQVDGFDQTKSAATGSVSFLDLPNLGGYITVTVTGSGTVSVGTLLVGHVRKLGKTGEAPSAGITDFSRKDVDGFGTITIVERAWAKRMQARALISTTSLDKVANRIAHLRATPALWVADDGTEALTIYGFFKEFSIEVGQNISTLSLSVEGLSKAAYVAPAADILDVSEKKIFVPLETARQHNIGDLVARATALAATASNPAPLNALISALTASNIIWLLFRNAITPLWDDVTAPSARDYTTWLTLNNAVDDAIPALQRGISEEDARRTTALQRGNSDLHNANADFATGVLSPFIGYSTQTLTMMPRADGSGHTCRLSVAPNVTGGIYFPNYAVTVPRGYRKMVVEFTTQSTLQASDWVIRLDQAGYGVVLNQALSALTPIGATGPVAYPSSGQLYRYELFVLITAATTDVIMYLICSGSYGGIVDITKLGWRMAEQTETDFITFRPAEAGATAGAVLGGNLLATPGGAVIPAVQLQNASIVVNADGTVSYNNGTGPINLGAVTISGLGFSGDLNATYGAETDANGVLIGSGGVEVDNNLIVTLQSPAGRVFTANHVPVLDAGQLPATFRFKLFRGAVDVSTTTTWAIVAQTGITGGTVTIADGVATIPTGCFIATSASITVTATRSGITRTGTVSLSRSDAPAPPSPPGGGTTNGDSTLNSVTGTTLVAISDEIEFSTGASGVATFSGALSLIAAAAANDGTFGAVLRWKIKPTGGSYSDVGASNINDDYPALVTYDSELGGGIYFAETGAINAGASKTGLATGTVHFAQLWGARDDATIAKTVSFGGSVSVTGT